MRWLNGFLILILFALQLRLWVGEGSIGHNIALGEKIEQQQLLNKTLHERNAILVAQVIDLQKGYAGIEEYARSQLGMVKPEETFYLVVSPSRQ